MQCHIYLIHRLPYFTDLNKRHMHGAYSIFRVSGAALICGQHLFEGGAYFKVSLKTVMETAKKIKGLTWKNTSPMQSGAWRCHMNNQTLKILLLALYRSNYLLTFFLQANADNLLTATVAVKRKSWSCHTRKVYSVHARTEEHKDFEERTEQKSVEIYSLWTEKNHYK